MELEILKDKYLNCWVVWGKRKNYMVDLFHAKTKRVCSEWVAEHGQKYIQGKVDI